VLVAAVLSNLAPLSSFPAAAALLDSPHVIADLVLNLGQPDRFSTNRFGTFMLVSTGLGAVSVNAIGAPFPSVAASADIGPNTNTPSIFGRGAEVLTYAFEILGPAGPVPVQIDVMGAASASATSGASYALQATWDLLDGGTSLAGDAIRSGQQSGSFSQHFDHTVALMLLANHVYGVQLVADAAAAATVAGSHAVADAFVDPIFSFETGVDTQRYSFHFSEGIGNTRPAAIPAPGVLCLMSIGLLILFGARRRRFALHWH
jgi:hypothetical protein